jgi:ADP-heptose:LPS heptosyltransferase
MTIKLMRRVDFWLGIPLCFLLNGINYILKALTFKEKENTAPQKILFIKLSEMGSIILAYPLIEKAKKEYPSVGTFFLTFEKNRPICGILNIVPSHNILTIREDSIRLFIFDTLRAIKKIRKEKMDIVFDLEFFSRFTAILTYVSGAAKRVGLYRYSLEGLYRGNFLTHKVQYNPLLHVSKSYLSLWQVVKADKKTTPELKEKIDDGKFSLPILISSEKVKKQAWNRLRRLGIEEQARLWIINPGEGNIPLREWSLENFIILARRLLEEEKNYVVVIGTQEASKKAQLLCHSVNNKRCLDLTNKTTLREALDLFNIADALITNDCGLAHLASLTPIRKFVIFGPESPQVYAPLGENSHIIYSDLACSPCLSAFNHRNSACRDNICLKRIRPDDVYEIVNKYIKK